MVSWVRFPFLSGLPAIFQLFFKEAISAPHLGHFAINIPSFISLHGLLHKTLSIYISIKSLIYCFFPEFLASQFVFYSVI